MELGKAAHRNQEKHISFVMLQILVVLSAGVNVFLDDLISFMPELSLSWNLQLFFQNFIYSTTLSKFF